MDRARIAHEFAARPVEPGDMRDRHHRQAELRVDLDDAVFVGGLVARRAPRALGVDDQLAVVGHLALGVGHRLLERDRPLAAIHRDHAHLHDVPAEERDPLQLALQDVERVAQIGEKGDRVPEGLVLRRQDEAAFGQVLKAGDIAFRAGHLVHQPQARVRPEFRHHPGAVAWRQEEIRRPEDHLEDQIGVEDEVERQ